MGYIKDEHLIISCGDEKLLESFRGEIVDFMQRAFAGEERVPDYASYISPILSTMQNGWYYLYLPPDGSKEGWDVSTSMDDVREDIRSRAIYLNAKNKAEINIIKVTDDEYLVKDNPYVETIL